MSGETEQSVSGWTVDTLKEHHRAIRQCDQDLADERDRRYAEVNVEREKALKIKETADETARILAREIQDYKDEKANNLRDQITAERGTYATKDDLHALGEKFEQIVKPLTEYRSGRVGRDEGIGFVGRVLVTVLTLLVATLGIALAFAIATR